MRCSPASVGRSDSHFMSNAHLFELINAAPHPEAWQLNLALALAQWLIFLVPVGMALAWIRGDRVARLNLLDMLLATLLALGVAQVIVHVWPQPRPSMLHLGTQLMPHAGDPGLPSDHVTVDLPRFHGHDGTAFVATPVECGRRGSAPAQGYPTGLPVDKPTSLR